MPTIQLCLNHGFALPSTLDLSTHSQLSTLGADFSPQSQLDVAWRATALAFSDPPSSAAPRLEGASQCAETFLRTIKAVGLKSPHASRRVALSCGRLRPPSSSLDNGAFGDTQNRPESWNSAIHCELFPPLRLTAFGGSPVL